MKGTLTFSWVLALNDAFSLLPDICKHKNLCWASLFPLALSNCSLCHWWAISFQAGTVGGCGGGKVKRGGVQTVGKYTAGFRCGRGCSCLGKVVG